jgi:arabinose-5-phosphate isomerase
MDSSPRKTGTESLEDIERVLRTEANALISMISHLGEQHVQAIDLLEQMKGRVILTGVGKSGHIARKAAATFASTGTPAQFVHSTEASHGDLGMIGRDDVCIAISNSGETAELADLITYARRFSIPLIAITRFPYSTLGAHADVTLTLPDATEACPIGVAPTTSTTASLALCDALAVALMNRKGFRREDFDILHPGGRLGALLLRVGDLMHAGKALPLVSPDSNMGEGLLTMTAKGFGLAGVVDEAGRHVGIVTDGDLRRNLNGLLEKSVLEVATRAPKTIEADSLASEALRIMNDRKISALFVVDADRQVQGLLHIHDCVRAGIV